MTTWIVSEFYHPDENATGYLLTQLAEGLAKGTEVSVVTCRVNSKGKSNKSRELHNNVNIYRCRVPRLERRLIVLRIVRDLVTSVSLSVSLFRYLSAGDKVLVATNPPALPSMVRLVAKFKAVKYAVLTHDVYPEVLVAAELIRPNGWAAAMLRFFSRNSFQNASMVVVIGRDMKELLEKTYDLEDSRLRIINNWGDTKTIVPSRSLRDSALMRFGLSEKFVVQYVGTAGRMHNLDILVEAAAMLIRRKDIAFLVIGDGSKADWLRMQITRRRLTNVVFRPFLSRAQQAEAHAAGDIAFISFSPTMNGVSVPSRMYNMMAAGKPILAVTLKSSELARVIEEEQIGWVASSNDPQEVVRLIEVASTDHDLRSKMSDRARYAAEKKYSLEVILPKFRRMLDEMQ